MNLVAFTWPTSWVERVVYVLPLEATQSSGCTRKDLLGMTRPGDSNHATPHASLHLRGKVSSYRTNLDIGRGVGLIFVHGLHVACGHPQTYQTNGISYQTHQTDVITYQTYQTDVILPNRK